MTLLPVNMKKRTTRFIQSYLIMLTCSILFQNIVIAQEKINPEYRFTVVPTYAVSNKIFLTTYIGYVNNPGTNTTSYYIGAPLLVTYKPVAAVEFMAGAFLVINKVTGGVDSKEFRPLAGLKFTIPNTNNLHIFNWTRYEYRSFNYDDKSLNNVKNRLRNRVAVEFPLSKNAWEPKSWYGFSDFEFFYTFEKRYFDRFRQRFGIGYVVNKQWKAEFIYHIQMLKNGSDLNPQWTDNIFRLNLKWAIPNKKFKVNHTDQLDMDE